MKKLSPSFSSHGQISREDIENGLFEEMITLGEKSGHFQRMPESERDKSRWEILAQLPKGQDIWLYAYDYLAITGNFVCGQNWAGVHLSDLG
jgi:hypothetical protein